MSRKHLPAAVPVAIACSVAFNDAPLARTARTVSFPYTPREAINAGDHQHIAHSQESEHGAQADGWV
jgi:hypothetical protein